MKNLWKRIFELIILFTAVAMFSITASTAVEASTPQTYTTDDSIQVEAKYKKVSTNKITFNGNGGKIGPKKTVAINIKKGSKIKKFPATPKRTGYSFKGWYTQKSGGKKISVNTKPTKSLSYFAQWTKTKTLNADEKKLVGTWYGAWTKDLWNFNKDGTFTSVSKLSDKDVGEQGVYSVTKGVLTLQKQTRYDYGSGWQPWSSSSTVFYGITFEAPKDGKQYMVMDYKNLGLTFSYYKNL